MPLSRNPDTEMRGLMMKLSLRLLMKERVQLDLLKGQQVRWIRAYPAKATAAKLPGAIPGIQTNLNFVSIYFPCVHSPGRSWLETSRDIH